MKSILIIGAGITGGYISHRLFKSGADVTLLARDEKAKRLKEEGLYIKDGLTGITEVVRIPIVEKADTKEYELVMVCVQEVHREEIEKLILTMRGRPIVWFLGNNAGGFDRAGETLGKDRILGGFPDVGGTWDGETLVYADRQKAKDKPFNKLIIGNAFIESAHHVDYIINEFKKMNIGVVKYHPISDWHLSHLVLVLPLAGIYYHFDGYISKIIESKEYLNKCIAALLQGLKLLEDRGHKVLPGNIKLFRYTPKVLIRKKLCMIMTSKMGKIALLGHADNARGEMKYLAEELLKMTNEETGKEFIEIMNEI